MVNDDPFEWRKGLTFEQAEGAAPLPTQLKPKELHSGFEACLVCSATLYHTGIDDDLDELGSVTSRILSHLHVFHYYRTDDFDSSLKFQLSAARTIIVKGSYIEFFGFLQAILKHGDCPANVSRDIGQAFLHGRAAYFILNGGTIVPKSSSEEVITLQKALSDLHDAELGGARTHAECRRAVDNREVCGFREREHPLG